MKPAIFYPPFWQSQNEEKGYHFEQWVVKQFPDEDFLLREWRSDKHLGKRSADSGKNPDLIFQCRDKIPANCFAVECKFRTNINDNKQSWASKKQLKNYISFQYKYNINVYIAFGYGGYSFNPQKFSFIPLSAVESSLTVSKKLREEFICDNLPFSKSSPIFKEKIELLKGIKI